MGSQGGYHIGRFGDALLRERRRRESRKRSAGRTRFQLTPDSVRGEMMRRYAPQGGAAVDAVPESVSGDAPRRIGGVLLPPTLSGVN